MSNNNFNIFGAITDTLIERGIPLGDTTSGIQPRTWNQAEAQVEACLVGGELYDAYYIRYGAIPRFEMDDELFERGQLIAVEDIRDGMFVYGGVERRREDGSWGDDDGEITFGQINVSPSLNQGWHEGTLEGQTYRWKGNYNFCGGELSETEYTQLYHAVLRNN